MRHRRASWSFNLRIFQHTKTSSRDLGCLALIMFPIVQAVRSMGFVEQIDVYSGHERLDKLSEWFQFEAFASSDLNQPGYFFPGVQLGVTSIVITVNDP